MATSKIIRLYGKEVNETAVNEATTEYHDVKKAYEINMSRSPASAVDITINDDDIVEIEFTDGTTWMGDRNTLYQLFPQLKEFNRSGDTQPTLPAVMSSDSQSRGIAAQVGIKLFNILARKKITETLSSFAEKIEDKVLEDKPEGLYFITADFQLSPFKEKSSTQAPKYLLFIHGTASSTQGGFSELVGSELWKELRAKYEDNIIGLEQRTLTKSPFDNVLTLFEQLPTKGEIDVITHSRGGLVGELLVRFLEFPEGFSDETLALLDQDENYKSVKKVIDEITSTIKKRKLANECGIKVNRFIRVAATGAGTSLLAHSTDVFLNTLANLLTHFGPPVYQTIAGLVKGMISEAIQTKNSFDVLPGVEAQRPESVFIKLINSYLDYDEQSNPIRFQNSLIVISGNGRLSVSLDGLKIALTKFLFKWGDNDLVVDTLSMYQGAKRKNPTQYFLDNTKETNHFRYFRNNSTRDALRNALFSSSSKIPGFAEITPEPLDAIANRGIFGLDSGKLAPIEKLSDTKPILILLPGIMGSFLEKGTQPFWINYWQFAKGGLFKLLPAVDDGIQATGVIKTAYASLTDYLSAYYDVVVFPYDWRNTLQKAGNALDKLVNDFRKNYKQPILLMGHSMGGLVIRDLMINHEPTWKFLNQQKNFRTVLLGTPWLGSYRIPHVLAGKDPIIKQLSLIDLFHTKKQLVNLFNNFPGIIDLLPIDDQSEDFSNKILWGNFVTAAGIGSNMISSSILSDFKNYRDAIKQKLPGVDLSNVIYVAGQYKETVCDYEIENNQLQFYATAEGDQSVTWATGIPAQLDRAKAVFYTQVSHGSLANNKSLFSGLKDILKSGTTDATEFRRQPFTEIISRGKFVAKETVPFEATDITLHRTLLGFDDPIEVDVTNAPIVNVVVSKGDLMFASYPILIGHFYGDGIYSAEAVANSYLKNEMQLKHALGLYPGMVGTSEIFRDEQNVFKGAMVIGLGQAEDLTPRVLTETVEKAVCNYLIKICKKELLEDPDKKFGISTLLIGAGYGGFNIENTCRAIIQGVVNANVKVSTITEINNLYLSTVEFIELFEDKALTCYNCLNNLISGNSDGLNIGWHSNAIISLAGVRKRLLTDENVSWWQRLSVTTSQNSNGHKMLTFNSSTNNAREESQQMTNSLWLLESLFEEISKGDKWSYETAKSLFEILIPNDFKERIRRHAPVLWVLDEEAASYPWELLHTGGNNEKPLCISSGMIRQLATRSYRNNNSNVVRSNRTLVIGDPDLENLSLYRQLEGAFRESDIIVEKFKKAGGDMLVVDKAFKREKSSKILVELTKQPYKILHIAAHGNFNPDDESDTGIIIGKRKGEDKPIYLTAEMFDQMPGVPELVYINACNAGKMDADAEAEAVQNLKLAANIGTALIRKGVKAVVVAGWQIHDTAALVFANEFYEKMLNGYEFGDAVLEARKKTYYAFPGTNTWGAFQCYGQPQYKLDIGRREWQEKPYDYAQQAENDLENLISKTEVAFYTEEKLLAELKSIHKKITDSKVSTPGISQLLAIAYMELGDYANAMTQFEKLFTNENAVFNVKSLENYQDISIKSALFKFFAEENNIKEAERKAIIELIDKGANNIKKLIDIFETGERYTLLGSAYKRKARVLKSRKLKSEALDTAATYYFSSYKILGDSYSLQNWLGLYLLKNDFVLEGEQQYFSANTEYTERITKQEIMRMLEKLKNNLERISDKKDFWHLSQKTDLLQCKIFLANNNPSQLKKWSKEFEDEMIALWDKTGSRQKKSRQMQQLKLWEYFAKFAKATDIGNTISNLCTSLDKRLANGKS